jgi:hypothetical protein
MATKNGKPPTTHRVEEVTPAKAKQWMKLSKHNRKISKTRVALYRRQIEEKKWGLTGEPIIFNAKGHLVDGQHRLMACIEADTPFLTSVVRGVAAGMQNLMGQGQARSAAQVLQMNGMAYYAEFPAALRALHKVEYAEEHGCWPSPNAHNYMALTNPEILKLSGDESMAKMIATLKKSDARAFLKPVSLFVGVFHHLNSRNEARAKKFLEGLINGSDLEKNSPVLKLRNLLIKAANTTATRRTAPWKVAITLKAWNLWLSGLSTRVLQVRENEEWPKTTKRYQPRRRKA